MQTVTVTGTRPSDDFAPPAAPSLSASARPACDMPQSVTVINKALMQSQGATSLASALRNVPGVTIGAAEGGQIGNNINLNGFSARTDLYLDGMRDPRPVLSRHLRARADRGADGPVVDAVRPRLDRRRDQPGLQEAVADKTRTSSASSGTHQRPRCAPRPTSTSRLARPSAFRVAAMFQEGNASTRDQTDVLDFGIAPSLQARHRHADRSHALRRCCSTTTTRPTTACRR